MNIFDKFANAERKFFSSEFMSPVISGGTIRVKLNNIVTTFKTNPPTFSGWGIFRAVGPATAALIREANRGERKEYLDLYPVVRFYVAQVYPCLGYYATSCDSRFKITGLVPIQLASGVNLFDCIDTAFDGANFWFIGTSRLRPKSAISRLSESFINRISPSTLLSRSEGLTKEETEVYSIVWNRDKEVQKLAEEDRIRVAVERGGGKLRKYTKSRETYIVEYSIDGQVHKSVVNESLHVQSAGICLAGGDRAFDLQSLVGVIREGIATHRIVRVGNNR